MAVEIQEEEKLFGCSKTEAEDDGDDLKDFVVPGHLRKEAEREAAMEAAMKDGELDAEDLAVSGAAGVIIEELPECQKTLDEIQRDFFGVDDDDDDGDEKKALVRKTSDSSEGRFDSDDDLELEFASDSGDTCIGGDTGSKRAGTLTEYQRLLLRALKDLKGVETFATGCRMQDVPLPGLRVKGIGPIALPLLPAQTNALIAHSTQAPFGRGADTVVDTSVRLCRQIEAEDVEVSNGWNEVVQKYAREFSVTLGAQQEAEKHNVEARLYKLVLYEEGGFFKAHKDTEKEPGMFGSLVLQLPSKHDEGTLVVRHRGKEEIFDFSHDSDAYFYASAFYADCEHELRPVRNGLRLCLLYNLVRVGNGELPRLTIQREDIVQELANAGQVWEREFEGMPVPPGENTTNRGNNRTKKIKLRRHESVAKDGSAKPYKLAILLNHQYTKTNLCFASLKGWDLECANALRQSGAFELHLALIERHKSGSGDPDFDSGYGRRRRYCRPSGGINDGPHPMTEVHSDDICIEKWVDMTDATVRNQGIEIDHENETLNGKALFDSDDEVDKEDYEGYMGNYGPNIDYWYYCACLVVWPVSFSLKLACSAGLEEAIHLARRRLNDQAHTRESNLEMLKEICNYAKRVPLQFEDHENSLHLADLLEVTSALNDLTSALDVLQQMNVPNDIYSSIGCTTERRKEAILTATRQFGWDALRDVILPLVTSVPASALEHSVNLAFLFKEDGLTMGASAVVRAVAARVDDNSRHLADLLEIVSAMNDLTSALDVLQQMNTPPKWGCSTERRNQSIFTAIRQFGWDALRDVILQLVTSAPESALEQYVNLSFVLKEDGFTISAGAMASAIAKRIGLTPNNSLCGFRNGTGPLAKMFFMFPECTEHREGFVSRVTQGGRGALRQLMEVLVQMKRVGVLEEEPEGFEKIVKDFGDVAFPSKEASANSVEDAISVFKILLEFKDLSLQEVFVQAVLRHESPTLLKALIQIPKVVEAAGNPCVSALAKARAKQLRYERPHFSNCQPHAEVHGHPIVTEFFRSDQKTMTYQQFKGIGEARAFAAKHSGGSGQLIEVSGRYNSLNKTSATWMPGGVRKKSYVTIEKTDALYREMLQKFTRDQEELAKLEPLLTEDSEAVDLLQSKPSVKRARLSSS